MPLGAGIAIRNFGTSQKQVNRFPQPAMYNVATQAGGCWRRRPLATARCHRPARAALSPRALTRARYGGAALGLPSRASSCPCSDQPMALSARACCAGAAAKAPTQRAARRNRRRMWCLGLRLDAQGGGGGGGGDRTQYSEASCARHRRHATEVSSVNCRNIKTSKSPEKTDF